MTCIRYNHGTAKRFRTYGKLHIQRFRCRSCKATFTEPRQKPLGKHRLDEAKAADMGWQLKWLAQFIRPPPATRSYPTTIPPPLLTPMVKYVMNRSNNSFFYLSLPGSVTLLESHRLVTPWRNSFGIKFLQKH